MSRFFRGDSSSDSDATTSSSSSSEAWSSEESDFEEVEEKKPSLNKFLRGAADSDSDSDDDMPKVVRSAKDKKLDEMKKTAENVIGLLEANEWIGTLADYDKMNKLVQKFGSTPKFFIKMMLDLQAGLEVERDLKKMNALQAKALTALRQKFKKDARTYETLMAKYNPEEPEEEEEEEEEKPTKVLSDLTIPQVFDQLNEVMDARGKKSTDKMAQIDLLLNLLKYATTPYSRVRVLIALLSCRFDAVSSSLGYLPTDMWKSALLEHTQLYDLLDAHPHIVIGEDGEEDIPEIEKDTMVNQGTKVCIRLYLGSFVDRLDDEFYKSLQSIDPNTLEYIERLQDESLLYNTIVRSQKYNEQKGLSFEANSVILLRRLEHLYYKPLQVISKIESLELVPSLAKQLMESKIDRIRIRAIICLVHYLSLSDKYHQARDLMLMSRLQEIIFTCDVPTQIMYNRCVVQLGLCAFRAGLFRETANILQDIACGKTKELLAQGMSKYEKTIEEEKVERSRQVPFHMHVNLELLEAVYLTSAMLLEIPNMALHSHDSKKRIISKSFRRMLDFYERQMFTGPPENTREYIMAAAKNMAVDWKLAREYIFAIKIWKLFPEPSKILVMIGQAIQQEALATFVFSYYSFYETFDITRLSKMFELEESTTCSILSKLILNGQLDASIQDQIVCIKGKKMSSLQFTASQFVDKIVALKETNEKMAEAKAVVF